MGNAGVRILEVVDLVHILGLLVAEGRKELRLRLLGLLLEIDKGSWRLVLVRGERIQLIRSIANLRSVIDILIDLEGESLWLIESILGIELDIGLNGVVLRGLIKGRGIAEDDLGSRG